uniref:Uncharacterized protein n=1 Tax=Lepeophtheirus salmonis TaxID=72036 RepID=A0A0K2V2T4_LEPSM
MPHLYYFITKIVSNVLNIVYINGLSTKYCKFTNNDNFIHTTYIYNTNEIRTTIINMI